MRRLHLAPVLLAFTLLAAVGTAAAEGIVVPTAGEAVRLALVNSSEAAMAKARLEAALAGDASLRAALLGWRFDAVFDDTVTETETLKAINDPHPVPLIDLPLNTLSATLAIRKALGAAGTTKLALDESRLQAERATRDYGAELRQIALTAYEAYRQLELALIQYRILQRSVDLTRDALDVAEDQYASGAQSEARLEEARVAHREAQNGLAAASRMLDIAWLRLARLLGLDPEKADILDIEVLSVEEALQMIVEDHPVFRPESAVPWRWSVDEAVEIALDSRPEILGARDAVQLARLGVEKVKLDRRPTIQLSANATTEDQIRASLTMDNDWVVQGSLTAWWFDQDMPKSFPDGSSNPVRQAPSDGINWDIGIRVTYNLWDSGASRAGQHQAEQAVVQAELGLEQARHGITLDVQSRYAEVQSAYDSLLIASQRAKIALLDLETEEQKAALGTSSPLQVDAAKMELWQKVIGAVSARFEYENAVLRLAQAVGLGLEDVLETVDDLQGW